MLELLLNDILHPEQWKGHFISRAVSYVTINRAKYQLIQMKLIRPSPSVIGWILSLSTKINSTNNKLKYSPRSSCEQVRRNYLIKSTIVRNIPVNEVELTETISREEAFMWRKKKSIKNLHTFYVKLENYFYKILFLQN